MLVTHRARINARRDEFQAVTQAMAHTLRWFAATDPTEIARALHDFFPAIPGEILAGAIARYRALNLWSTDPRPNRAGFERLHAAMRSSGTLASDVAYDDCVEESLAIEASIPRA